MIIKNRDQENWEATLAGPNWGLMTLTFQPCLTPPYSLHPSYFLCSPLTLVLLEDSSCYRAVFPAAVTLRVGVLQSAWDAIYIFLQMPQKTQDWTEINRTRGPSFHANTHKRATVFRGLWHKNQMIPFYFPTVHPSDKDVIFDHGLCQKLRAVIAPRSFTVIRIKLAAINDSLFCWDHLF